MPREFPRSRRVEEQIQRILGETVRAEAGDQRLQKAIITHVRVSRDLSVAWVDVTSLDPGHTPEQLLEAFSRAGGFLRRAVADQLTVRRVPELRFRYDDTAQRAADMEALIERAVQHDRDSTQDVPDD